MSALTALALAPAAVSQAAGEADAHAVPAEAVGSAAQPTGPADVLLALRGLEARYEGVIVALRGVTLEVGRGRIVALLGANGAGKSTTLKAVSRLLAAERGEVSAGQVLFEGRSLAGVAPHEVVRRGISQVLEGRRCFAGLSVDENLRLGGFVRRPSRGELSAALERVYERFPRLKERRRVRAGLTSGGEQQMVAIGRALMAAPRLVLLDEPSMGLAPLMVQEIFRGVRELNERDGVSFLLAEQNAAIALCHAHHAYVLADGRVALGGSAAALRERDDMQRFYLGDGDAGRRPYLDPHRVRAAAPAAA